MKETLMCSVLWGLVLLVGCNGGDHYRQVAEVAQQGADRQAQQNTEMVRVHREVAEGTRRMVEADSQARQEIVAVHHELQAERAVLNGGFDALESERQQIAQDRRTESMLVPAAQFLAGAGVAIVVLVFCIALLHGNRHQEAIEAELNELLVQELAGTQPQLFCRKVGPPALGDEAPSDLIEQSDAL